MRGKRIGVDAVAGGAGIAGVESMADATKAVVANSRRGARARPDTGKTPCARIVVMLFLHNVDNKLHTHPVKVSVHASMTCFPSAEIGVGSRRIRRDQEEICVPYIGNLSNEKVNMIELVQAGDYSGK